VDGDGFDERVPECMSCCIVQEASTICLDGDVHFLMAPKQRSVSVSGVASLLGLLALRLALSYRLNSGDILHLADSFVDVLKLRTAF
jgi:hypothetical protein